MAVASELMASGLSALSSNLLGDDSGPIVLTYNSEGILPASESPVGFAITNNYEGFGEVDFWNLVNNDADAQGWYFQQKTGASTSKLVGALFSDTDISEFQLYSPDDSRSVEFGTNNVNGFLNSTGLMHIVTGETNIATGGVDRLLISGTGTITVVNSLLQNKAVATPVTGATVTMAADQRYQAIAPAGTIAALTLVLPPSPVDSQAMSAGSSQIVTALTTNAGTGGATVVGAPTALAASSGFTMVYQSSNNTWYRAG